jgi:hypothetical protein
LPDPPAPDDLIFPDVAADMLGLNKRQVQRMVARGELRPYAYVKSKTRRLMVFRAAHIAAKKRQLATLQAAKNALREP